MKGLIFGTILFLAVCPVVFGQTAANNCPKITITGPPGVTMPGDRMTFSVNVLSSVRLGKLEYAWTVSTGKIVRGPGTSGIDVLTGKKDQNSNITATVKVTGIPVGCRDNASEMGSVAAKPPNENLDEFGRLSKNNIKARIDSLYIYLSNSPTYEGLLVVYLNKNETRMFKKTYLNTLYDAIIWLRKDLARVSFVVYEGEFETRTVVWTIPPGFDLEDELGIKESDLVKGEELKARMKTLFLKSKK